MAVGRLGVSPRLGGLATVWSVTRGGLKVTDGAVAIAAVGSTVKTATA
jgi:hypothetical protein